MNKQLSEIILNKSEIKKLDVFISSFFEPAKIENYYGKNVEEKTNDFCDRYWNLLHGWKMEINNQREYDEYI